MPSIFNFLKLQVTLLFNNNELEIPFTWQLTRLQLSLTIDHLSYSQIEIKKYLDYSLSKMMIGLV